MIWFLAYSSHVYKSITNSVEITTFDFYLLGRPPPKLLPPKGSQGEDRLQRNKTQLGVFISVNWWHIIWISLGYIFFKP
jgi:hypothetical protein